MATEEEVLRAKYLDWCSARVADRLFRLPPEQIYELTSALGTGMEPGADFRAIIGRLTEELRRELELPDFAAWRDRYERDPRPYEADMIGFWRELLRPK
ncbi:MAG: hypothetical protein GX539_05835 [Candidatus Cloacimonetes bacterium]|nr:hypothetical protein [Candidatus Cloacimonadota bacterium]